MLNFIFLNLICFLNGFLKFIKTILMGILIAFIYMNNLYLYIYENVGTTYFIFYNKFIYFFFLRPKRSIIDGSLIFKI